MQLKSTINVLEAAQLAIYNTEKEESIRQQTEAYGFTPVRMQTGKSLPKRRIASKNKPTATTLAGTYRSK